MDIRISGHQVATGDALKDHVSDRLQGIATKYFARALSAEVTFGKGPHDVGFKCDIVVHVMKGLGLKGSPLRWRGRQDRDAAAPLHAPPEGSACQRGGGDPGGYGL